MQAGIFHHLQCGAGSWDRGDSTHILVIYGTPPFILVLQVQIPLIRTRHLFEGIINPRWDTTYDIYVKTDTKEKTVAFIYKAAIQYQREQKFSDKEQNLSTEKSYFAAMRHHKCDLGRS